MFSIKVAIEKLLKNCAKKLNNLKLLSNRSLLLLNYVRLI